MNILFNRRGLYDFNVTFPTGLVRQFTGPYFVDNTRALIQIVEHIGLGYNPVRAYRAFYDKYGLWPKNFAKLWFSQQVRLFELEPYFRFLYKWSLSRKKMVLCNARSQYVVANKPILDQVVEDGLFHLVPIVAFYGENPQQLKQRLGKSLWKKISNNSFSRNVLLYERLRTQDPDSALALYAKIPSTLLKVQGLTPYNVTAVDILMPQSTLKAKAKLIASEFGSVNHHRLQLLSDILRMADTLQRKVKVPYPVEQKWIDRKHEEFVQLIADRRVSPKPFRKECILNFKGLLFTELVSPLDYVVEGKTMHHCVGGYIDSALNGTYRAFAVESDGVRATLGAKHNFNGLVFDQVYSYCNGHVAKEVEQTCVEFLKHITQQKL